MCIFRLLKASEIDVRVAQITTTQKGVKARLLLYKDARVDMQLLDEHFGTFGWQREHFFKDGKNYCRISVKNPDTGEWIAKEDVGVESYTEKTKGESSDSFKRAAVTLGIGRELYTAGVIDVTLAQGEYYSKQGSDSIKLSNYVTFYVSSIDYDLDTRSITALEIKDHNDKVRYSRGKGHDPLFSAVAEMNACKSIEQSVAVWRKYKEYQDDPRFVAAKEQKKEQLTQQ